MRMRERSSVERMRMALTEKRDMLGDIMAGGGGGGVGEGSMEGVGSSKWILQN